MTNLTKIDLSEAAPELLADIADLDGHHDFTAWSAPYDGATVSNQAWNIVHSAELGIGGVVFVGSGSSGHTFWTTADTPEEVLARHLADDMISV